MLLLLSYFETQQANQYYRLVTGNPISMTSIAVQKSEETKNGIWVRGIWVRGIWVRGIWVTDESS